MYKKKNYEQKKKVYTLLWEDWTQRWLKKYITDKMQETVYTNLTKGELEKPEKEKQHIITNIIIWELNYYSLQNVTIRKERSNHWEDSVEHKRNLNKENDTFECNTSRTTEIHYCIFLIISRFIKKFRKHTPRETDS